MIPPADYFDLSQFDRADLFDGLEMVWDVLDRIKPYLQERLKPNLAALKAIYPDLVARTVVIVGDRVYEAGFELRPGDTTKGQFEVLINGRPEPEAVVVYGGATLIGSDIQLEPGVVVESGALIKSPTLIGARTEVRQGAYLRGSCLIGSACVVGHATEVKNSVFLDQAKAGHFAYVGDSILGRDCNLGAGTKLANLKLKNYPTRYQVGGEEVVVKRRKLGAIIGDSSEIGCNTVTNPGVVLGPRSLVWPNSTVDAAVHRPRTVIRPG